MATSPKWGVPYIAEGQASPEITHNSALNMLQMQAGGVQALQNGPPGGPAEGDTYIVGSAPTGAWVGHANAIAGWFDGGWVFLPGVDDDGTTIPMGASHAGLTIYNIADDVFQLWSGSVWLAVEYQVAT
jgi:hypothetical protein